MKSGRPQPYAWKMRAIRLRTSGIIVLVFLLVCGLVKFSFPSGNYEPAQESHRSTNEKEGTADIAPGAVPFHVGDRFPILFNMSGRMYDELGPYANVEVQMQSSLIHSFSPYTENRFREMMLDPPKEQRIYANSPAMLWLPSKTGTSSSSRLLVVMRMWLEKEKYKGDGDKKMRAPHNDFSDNYLYEQQFDSAFRPVTTGHVLGIPTPTQWLIGDGPIEPRLIAIGNRTFMTFNTGAILSDGRSVDSTFAWDYDRARLIVPRIRGGAPMEKHKAESGMARDKHWAAFEDQGKLFFAYNLDPLRILRCDMDFDCEFVFFDGPEKYAFKQLRDHVRGGTPWVVYKYPYYISVAHGTFFKRSTWKRYYTTNLVVMSVRPTYRIVYSSATVQVHSDLLDSIPIVRFIYIHDPFLFPVSVLLEDGDTLSIGLHVNDHSSVAIRLRGLKKVMAEVMRLDEGRSTAANRRGPPPGALHNVTKQLAEMQSKYKLAHED